MLLFRRKKCEQISMKYYRSVTKSSLLLEVCNKKSINYAYELFPCMANKLSSIFLLHCFSLTRAKGLHFMISNAEERTRIVYQMCNLMRNMIFILLVKENLFS